MDIWNDEWPGVWPPRPEKWPMASAEPGRAGFGFVSEPVQQRAARSRVASYYIPPIDSLIPQKRRRAATLSDDEEPQGEDEVVDGPATEAVADPSSNLEPEAENENDEENGIELVTDDFAQHQTESTSAPEPENGTNLPALPEDQSEAPLYSHPPPPPPLPPPPPPPFTSVAYTLQNTDTEIRDLREEIDALWANNAALWTENSTLRRRLDNCVTRDMLLEMLGLPRNA